MSTSSYRIGFGRRQPCLGTILRLPADTFGTQLWTVSFVNGWCGYLPDKQTCLTGGYEASRTPLPPDGLLRYEAQAAEAILPDQAR